MPMRKSSLDIGYVDTCLICNLRYKSGMEISYIKLPGKNVKTEKGRHLRIEP